MSGDGWPQQRSGGALVCTIPDSCRHMMSAMLAEHEARLQAMWRKDIDDAVTRIAEGVAERTARTTIEAVMLTVFGKEKPEPERVTLLHEIMEVHLRARKLGVRLIIGGVLVVLAIALLPAAKHALWIGETNMHMGGQP
jgi:hypothetical protein